MTREKAIVCLSGGLDSSIALCLARESYEICIALCFDYGQRAAKKEKQAAQALARHFGFSLQEIALPWLKDCTSTALVNTREELPEFSADQLDERAYTEPSAAHVWVPNRNGVFINIAAAFAEEQGAKVLVTGFNAEEAATFPDNSAEYVRAVNASLLYSTQIQCRVESPTLPWTKSQIVAAAQRMGFPFRLLWSCYEGGAKMCGKCESCQRSKRAYLENGLGDLALELFL